MAEEKKLPQQTIINAGTVVGSTYSQIVNVSVTDIDVTLEFTFINPRDPSRGQVVARVTMPKPVGLQLAQLILTTNQVQEKRRRGNKDD